MTHFARFSSLSRASVFALGLGALSFGSLVACGGDDGNDAEDSNAGGQNTGGSASSGGSSNSGGSDSGTGGNGDDDDFTGTVTFDGTTIDCEVDTDDFPASGEFSVLCDNDDDDSNYRYVEIVFKNEASARTAQDLRFIGGFAFSPDDHPDADTIAVGWTDTNGTLYADDDSTGSAKVTASGGHFVLEITDVSLSNEEETASGTLSATIDF